MSIEIKDKSNKTFIVFGAPGSATSFISKLLEENGVDMHNTKVPEKRLFYEDSLFVNLNVDILAAAGGTWVQPPTEERIMATDKDDRIKNAIKTRKSKMWGFKDPRFALTGKKYLPFLEDDVYLICCFRKPKPQLASWARDKKVTLTNNRKLLDRLNKSIIGIIKEFCEL